MGPVSGSTKPTGPVVEILAPVGVSEPGALLQERPASPITVLVDRLAGELVLRHVHGRRVLDLGHGAPMVTEWVAQRSGTLGIVDALDLGRRDQVRLPFVDHSFDVVFSLRTLAHLGRDEPSSHAAAVSALHEIGRVLAPGGTALVQFDNAVSLWGLYHGIRNARTALERGPLVIEGPRGLTRFDNLRRIKQMIPPTLELLSFHGLRILVTLPHTLGLPLVGGLIERLEWFARDRALLRSLGAHVLVVLRRMSEPSR
jgi:SAM-dependent methyltransferase